MNAWQQLLLVWALAAVAQALAWARQQRTRNAGIVDVVWSFGVGSAAVVVAATTICKAAMAWIPSPAVSATICLMVVPATTLTALPSEMATISSTSTMLFSLASIL